MQSREGFEKAKIVLTIAAHNPVNATYQYPAAAVSGTSSWYAGTPKEPSLPDKYVNVLLDSPIATPLMSAMTNIGQAFEALVRGDEETCRRTYDALVPYAGQSLAIIAADRLLGQLAHAVGAMSQATGHFEDALEYCTKAAYRPEYACLAGDIQPHCWTRVVTETAARRRACWPMPWK